MDKNNLHLTEEQETRLEQVSTSEKAALRRRARVLLGYHHGLLTDEVARQAGLSAGRARYWRRQFKLKGMGIFPGVMQEPEEDKSTQLDSEAPKDETDRAAGQENLANIAPEYSSAVIYTERELNSGGIKQTMLEGEAGHEHAPQAEEHKPGAEEEHVSEAEEHLPQTEIGMEPGLPLPEPFDAPGILPLDTMAEAGRKILLYQFAEMLSHEAGTRKGSDLEELHDMRVATRRMRAAFDVFGEYFKQKTLNRYLKNVRRVGRALGRVRDMDVLIQKLQDHLPLQPEPQHRALYTLLIRWTEVRDNARVDLMQVLDSRSYDHFKQDFNLFLHSPGAGVKAKKDAPAPLVRDVAPVLIYNRLASVRAYDQLLKNASLDQMHALRIEFKKLRYAVEFFREVLGAESKEVIDTLKEVQDHLGNLNDARVTCQMLNEFLENWEGQQIKLPMEERQNPEPIVAYLAEMHAERYHLMITFSDTWAHFSRPEFRRNLALAISVL